MSLIAAVVPAQSAPRTPSDTPGPVPRARTEAEAEQSTEADGQPRGDADDRGGSTTAEVSQTGTALPPVTATRSVNAATQTRDGGEGELGGPGTAEDLADIRYVPDLEEDHDKRYAEAAQRKLLVLELLSRIPVPVEAIPKLTQGLEEIRDITDGRAARKGGEPG